ncbi:SKP1-like protein 7 [Phaseolus vulgaris]|uniref:SKP1-like protein 7 n=1 Tax=Phaseolus vulgaris TaxID=3885 RepID=UPI0035CBA9F9
MRGKGEESEVVMLRKAEEEKSKAVKKVKLVTSDGVTIEVEISTVKEMETIQAFINATDTDDSVIFPLPRVSSHILSRIMELISKEYDQELVKRLSHEELKEICMVANYLTLLHRTSQKL